MTFCSLIFSVGLDKMCIDHRCICSACYYISHAGIDTFEWSGNSSFSATYCPDASLADVTHILRSSPASFGDARILHINKGRSEMRSKCTIAICCDLMFHLRLWARITARPKRISTTVPLSSVPLLRTEIFWTVTCAKRAVGLPDRHSRRSMPIRCLKQ